VSAAFLDRTPFAIDVGDNEDDSGDLDLVHSEDDNQVVNEVILTFGTLIHCEPQVDTFLEANDSGQSEADKEVVKGEYMVFIGPLFPQRHHDPPLILDLLNVKPR